MSNQKDNKPGILHSLFWRIALVFLVILVVFSTISFYIYTYYSELYFEETIQRLNSGIAKTISNEREYFKNDTLGQDAVKELIHDIMVINPSLEIYLLDKRGKILSYFAPDTIIKLNKIPLEPIYHFIENYNDEFVKGPDPRNPGRVKPYAAAEIIQGGEKKGYIYVILNSEDYENVAQMIRGSYVTSQAARIIVITFFVAAIAAFIAIMFISGNVNKILKVIKRFKKGELNARINFKTKGELKAFADSFNDMADTIVENIKKIENIDRSRRELVANISHDLRTPLASISGYAETALLKADSLPPAELMNYINTIKNNSEKLQRLVDELFELSKLEARQRLPEKEAFSLKEIVQDNYQKNMLLAKSKSLAFTMDIGKEVPPVFADIAMIDRVIQNLIENSIKYTDIGGKVEVSLNDLGGKVEFVIQDTGKGLPIEEINYLLNLYDKPGSKRKIKGSAGLGLSIVKKILELHDSHIVAKSGENGARISFSLGAASVRKEKYQTRE